MTRREKPKEDKKKDKSREEAKKAKSKKSQPTMSMQQLITENLSLTRERQVKSSDYDKASARSSLHSSVAPIVPELDIDIDPELDMMLAQLENDDDFSGLGENEQKAWLESLFFQDTMHAPGRQPRDQLAKTKTQKKNTLRVNQDSATRLNPVEPKSRGDVEDPEAVTSVHVNDKMKDLAQDFFKPKTSSSTPMRKSSVPGERKASLTTRRSPSPPEDLPSPSLSRKSSFATPPTSRKTSSADHRNSITESLGEISGAKQDLTSLAQSYFQVIIENKE